MKWLDCQHGQTNGQNVNIKNLRNGTLGVMLNEVSEESLGRDKTPCQDKHGLYWIMNSTPVRFLVDTGENITIIQTQLWKAISVQCQPQAKLNMSWTP